MERKEPIQMFVISIIKQWRKEMRVCHALSLLAIEENKRHTSFPQPLASTLYAHQRLNGIKNIPSNIKVYMLYKIFAIKFIND